MNILLDIFFLSAFIVFVVSRQTIPADVHESCLEEVKPNKTALAEFNAEILRNYLTSNQISGTNDNSIKCYFSCVAEKVGLMIDGVVNVTVLIAINEDKGHHKNALYDKSLKCANKKGNNNCESAYQLVMCIINEHETF